MAAVFMGLLADCVWCKSIDYSHASSFVPPQKKDIFTFAGFILVFILQYVGFNNLWMDIGKMSRKGRCHPAYK